VIDYLEGTLPILGSTENTLDSFSQLKIASELPLFERVSVSEVSSLSLSSRN
jgi:hypothetical protein